MKARIWPATLAIALVTWMPTTAGAQQWSPEEQEVLDHVEECFASFTEASEQNDPQIWVDRCHPAEESLYWTSEMAGPISLQVSLRDWDLTFPSNRRVASAGFEPIRIRLVNDMAFVYGYSIWYTEAPDGTMTGGHGKRLEVYRKSQGQWGLYSIVWLPFEPFE